MGKLAYYASQISPNQFETPVEGYRICKNVPICRTGHQDYLGSELKRHAAYDPAWNLDDGTIYPVYRSLAEVTCPETISSAEGKSIVDEHPDERIAPGSLISRETERELGCGHVQNVRVGELIGGETPLLADMHIKDDALIDKVDGGVRDISCGYTYTLTRLRDGTFAQTCIRINHVAVVPKGRAGPSVAIKDAMPAEIQTKEERKPIMDVLNHILGLGLKSYATDAAPEDFATAMRKVNLGFVARDAAPDKDEDEKKDKEAKEAKDKKAAKDAEESDDKDKTIAELRAELAEMKKKLDSGKDKVAKDDAVDEVEELIEEHEDKKDEIVEAAKKVVDEKSDAEDDADVVDPDEDEAMKDAAKVKGAMDSARALVKAFKPLIASGKATKDQRVSYGAAVKSLNAAKGVSATGIDAYASLATVKGPDMTAGLITKAPESTIHFFAGVSVAEGQKRLAEHNRQKAGK